MSRSQLRSVHKRFHLLEIALELFGMYICEIMALRSALTTAFVYSKL